MERIPVHSSLDNHEAVEAHATSEDSDQNARKRRLILYFAGRPGLIVGFVVRWLICKNKNKECTHACIFLNIHFDEIFNIMLVFQVFFFLF